MGPSVGGTALETLFVVTETLRTLGLALSRGVTCTVLFVEGVRLRDKESWRGLAPVLCGDDEDSGDFMFDS